MSKTDHMITYSNMGHEATEHGSNKYSDCVSESADSECDGSDER
jgi:hypothetical protein